MGIHIAVLLSRLASHLQQGVPIQVSHSYKCIDLSHVENSPHTNHKQLISTRPQERLPN